MQRQMYYKVEHPDGSIAIFDTNNKELADSVKRLYEQQGAKVTEITRGEHRKLSMELD